MNVAVPADVSGDMIEYLREQEKKSLLRFLTCGSVDDGKSTLIGRLLYDTKLIFEDQLATLERDRPVLLIEAEERHHPDAVASIRALLEPLGYQGLFLDEGRLVSIRNFDVARDQGFTEADEAALLRDSKIGRRYINNFIFIA